MRLMCFGWLLARAFQITSSQSEGRGWPQPLLLARYAEKMLSTVLPSYSTPPTSALYFLGMGPNALQAMSGKYAGYKILQHKRAVD